MTGINVHPIDSATWVEVPATAVLAAGQWHFQVEVDGLTGLRNAPVDLASPVPAHLVANALAASFGAPTAISRARRTA